MLHAPERGARGHVHYVELDQFIGPGWYVTVHGPLNPKVAPEAAGIETGAVSGGCWRAGSTRAPRTSCRSPSCRR